MDLTEGIAINNNDDTAYLDDDYMQQSDFSASCVCGSGLDAESCCAFPGRNALNAPVYAMWDQRGLRAAIDDMPLTSDIENAAQRFDEPLLFPAEINFLRQKLYFVKMTPALLRQSVFLDPSRIQASCVVECDLDHAAKLADELEWQDASFIFHTAFCGSTLLTKALDALYRSLPLREPDLLGNIYYRLFLYRGGSADLTWLDRGMRMTARRFDALERNVIKVNDYVNPLISWVGRRRADTPMLFMYTPVEQFYAACIKAENRKQWLQQRLNYLRRPIAAKLPQVNIIDFHAEDYATQAAIYWSYNIVLYLQAYQQFSASLMSVDFNQLLQDPADCIEACAAHLRLTARDGVDTPRLMNELFVSYSKNSKLQYSPQLRQQEIIERLNQDPAALERLRSLSEQLLASYDYTLGRELPGDWRKG